MSPDGSMIFDADDIANEGPPAGPTAIAMAVPVDTNDVSSSNNSEGLIGDTPIAIAVADDTNDVSSSNNYSAGLAGDNAIAIAIADDTNDVSWSNNNSAGLAGNNAIAMALPIGSNEVPSSSVVRETLGDREDVRCLCMRIMVGWCALFGLWLYVGILLATVNSVVSLAWIFGPFGCACCCPFLSESRGGVPQ